MIYVPTAIETSRTLSQIPEFFAENKRSLTERQLNVRGSDNIWQWFPTQGMPDYFSGSLGFRHIVTINIYLRT